MTTSTSNYTTWSCLTENWWLQISVTKCLSMCSLFHFDNNESMHLLDHYRTCILFPTLTNSICLYLCKFYVASMVSPCVNQPSNSTKRRPSHYNNNKSRSTASAWDSRHTDKYLGLIMTLLFSCLFHTWGWLFAFAALGKAEPLVSTATRQKTWFLAIWPWPDLWPWPWPWPVTLTRPLTLTLKQGNSEVKTRFLAFDLDLWPAALTYNPKLAMVKVNLRTKYQGRRLNGSAVRGETGRQMDGQVDGQTLPSTLSPSLRGR